MVKTPPLSPRGMVVTEHPLATLAGWEVLRRGGSFADATVAVGATLAVVMPHLGGLGGDFFALLWLSGEKRGLFLNGSGRAPQSLSASMVCRLGLSTLPPYSVLSVTVPGFVDALWHLHRRFGRLPWGSLWETAIHLAEEGFPVSFHLANAIMANLDRLSRDEGARGVFFRDDRPLRFGEALRQPALAQTLRRIAEGGRDAFYLGAVAEGIVKCLQSRGSPMTREDFAATKSEWGDPLTFRYRDFLLLEMPPNAQGIVTLQAMALLESFPTGTLTGLSLAQLMVRVAQITAEERDAYLADPRFVPEPPQALLHPDRIARLRERLLVASPKASTLRDGDTTYFAILDERGNAISAIQSLFHAFGSGILDPQTGVLLQNRGANFVLTRGHPNELAPGKRPRHTLSALIILDADGKLKGVMGTSGGDFRPQIHAWLLVHWLDKGMPLQEAIEIPRLLWHSGGVVMEAKGTDPTPLQRQIGMPVQFVPYASRMGVAHGIERIGESWGGCADIRGDGVALPL